MKLLTDSPESRKEDILYTTHEFFTQVKETNVKLALHAAKTLDTLGYGVKIHRAKGQPAVQVRAKAVKTLYVETTKVKVTEAEYIILKALGQIPLHSKIGEDGTPLLVYKDFLKQNARIRAKLWNALAYIRRNL